MKILQAVHYFLPRHRAGTEIYTFELSRELARDNTVRIFTSEDGIPRGSRLEISDDEYEGLGVRRLIHPGPRDFRSSYEDPEFDRAFGEMLDEFKPDVVHFQHLYRLSTGFIQEAGRRGIPAVLTLADYWFICPPIIMLRPGFEVCSGPERGEACAGCGNAIGKFYAGEVPGFMLGIESLADRIKSAGHAIKRRLPPSWAESIRSLSGSRKSEQERMEFLTGRYNSIRAALGRLDLVISPSEFLRQKMIEAGMVEPDKIIHSDYGFRPLQFPGISRRAGGRFRFGFIGTLVEHKGVHVAVQAMNLLKDLDADLSIHGDERIFPGYVRGLRRVSRNPSVRFAGGFEHGQLPGILSGLDALIVPSLWYENSPLTIHEAFLAGIPVIASDMGGMAELVEDGVSGLRFRPGDADDLARAMKRLVTEPELLKKLKQGIPRVKTIEENAKELMEIYRRIQAGRT